MRSQVSVIRSRVPPHVVAMRAAPRDAQINVVSTGSPVDARRDGFSRALPLLLDHLALCERQRVQVQGRITC
jgi:hypothetical protein